MIKYRLIPYNGHLVVEALDTSHNRYAFVTSEAIFIEDLESLKSRALELLKV